MNSSEKAKEAMRLFRFCDSQVRHDTKLRFEEYMDCLNAIRRDPTGALRCYRAIANSYGGCDGSGMVGNQRKRGRA